MKARVKKAAIAYFENGNHKPLFVNPNGELFTAKDLALGSLDKDIKDKASKIKTIEKADVIKEKPVKELPEGVKQIDGVMVLVTDDGKELIFPAIKNEVREPVVGDQALVDGAEADGIFSFKGSLLHFKAGKLTEKELAE